MKIGILSSLISPIMTSLSRRVALDVWHEIVWEGSDSTEGESSQKLRVGVINVGGASVTLEPLQVFLPDRRSGISTMVPWRKLSVSPPAMELRLKRRERAESEIDLGKVYVDSKAPIKFTVRTQCGKEINRAIRRDVEQEPSLVHTGDIDEFLNTPFVEAFVYGGPDRNEVRRTLMPIPQECVTGHNLGEQGYIAYEDKRKPEKFLHVLKDLNDQNKLSWLRGSGDGISFDRVVCFIYGYGEITLLYPGAVFISRRIRDQSAYVSRPNRLVSQIMENIGGGPLWSLATTDITPSDYQRLVSSIDCYHNSKWKRILGGGVLVRHGCK